MHGDVDVELEKDDAARCRGCDAPASGPLSLLHTVSPFRNQAASGSPMDENRASDVGETSASGLDADEHRWNLALQWQRLFVVTVLQQQQLTKADPMYHDPYCKMQFRRYALVVCSHRRLVTFLRVSGYPTNSSSALHYVVLSAQATLHCHEPS
ncbi:hypothetical protein GY45DRAFT_961535 [Cubamyces sp. BRFM 1775]|nr:hypothetical protein GY45DRAFT_961535 [Cubamyces sp. BRFM 1775]